METPEAIQRFVRVAGPDHDEIQDEMAAYADEHGFPTVGQEVGGVLRLLARLTDAERIFEFGSGYGYSAYWFLKGMDDDGHVILTEFDADELDMARDFFSRAGLTEQATFEHGDAVAIVDDHDGPFDVVLVDHQKSRYAEAFERVRDKVPVGGVVVADNLTSPADADALLAYLEDGDESVLPDDTTRGIADYLGVVRGDDDFETIVLPVGEGLAVSTRIA